MPKIRGTLTPTAPTAIRLWETFTFTFTSLVLEVLKGKAMVKLSKWVEWISESGLPAVISPFHYSLQYENSGRDIVA